MSLPHDIQRLLQTVQGAREAEERLKAHKVEQAKLIEPKLEEVKNWVVKMADDLVGMVKANLSLFPNPFVISAPSVSVTSFPGEHVTLHFLGNDIVFEPFLERAMIQCRPRNHMFSGQYTQIDQVTEAWVRENVINQITHIMKADHLQAAAT